MSRMQNNDISRSVITITAVLLLIFLGYVVLTLPDHRSFGDRVGDAFHALPQGADKASEKLEDRTPGQKLGDNIKDAGQKLKDNTAPQ